MEKEIHSGKEDFEALFNYASVGIIATDSSGVITMVNPHALKLFCYAEEELIGKKIEVLIPASLRSRHEKNRGRYNHHPQNRPMGIGMDLQALRKDGTEFPVEISLAYYYVNDQLVALSFINDITLRKEQEQKIIDLNAELEEKVKIRTHELSDTIEKLNDQIQKTDETRAELIRANAFQKAILDYAGAIIIATDEKGIIQLFNPEAERMLGYKASEVINKQTPALFHDPQEMRERARQFAEELNIPVEDGFETFVARSRRKLANRYEWTYMHKNGTRFPVLLTISALQSARGDVIGFLGIANDISQRKKVEEELQRSLEKEKELSELKSRFVSMASHEFRTPLSTILSSVYLLSKYVTTEEQSKRAKHIDRIISSVTTLTDILNDFLSVGRIEEGKIQVKWKEADIREILNSVIKEMQGLLKKGQQLSYEHEGKTIAPIDVSLLKHIIMNLVSNAVKFSPENTSIEVCSKVTDGKILLDVKDKGIGISKEDQSHLFERFFRGENAGNVQGTGLGLHIVKKYVEMMNGSVSCKSELGKGTEIRVILNPKNQ